jgi:hypothetical protein
MRLLFSSFVQSSQGSVFFLWLQLFILLTQCLFVKNMGGKLLQNIKIKFLVKLEKYTTDIYRMLQQVYGEGRECRTQVFVWLKQFQDG